MKILLNKIAANYFLHIIASMFFACGLVWFITHSNILWSVIFIIMLTLSLWTQWRLHRTHIRRLLFLLDAIENNDYSIHYPESDDNFTGQEVNRALNRIAKILYNVKIETAQQEKYYELILDCVNTGIIVINNEGAVYQKNNEALRLFGLEILTHIKQLAQIDNSLVELLGNCHSEDRLQFKINNERGTLNLSIRVSGITVRKEYLRIIAFNDINSELDEREIDSWIRLTRVLTHEIMNAVTPITSLSDTLLSLVNSHEQGKTERIRNGLQTINITGKGLLDFVESYRRFTRIPTPSPTLFYVKALIERMIELTRHQNPDIPIQFRITIVPDDLMLYADENLISQVLINILKNAVQAIFCNSKKDGIIMIHAYCNEVEDIFIEISNNGPLIPSEIRDHIFIPFFTTKENGSGIGLSISRQIMRISGGSLSLRSSKETTFILKFR